MSVKRINLQPTNFVTKNNVIAVIRQRRFFVDVGHSSLSGRHNRIGGFTMVVTLHATDIQTFMKLPSLAPDTTKATARPGFTDRADEKLLLFPRLEQGVVGRGQLKRLGRKEPN